MLLFVGEKSFQSDLLPTLRKLASDENWKVRRTLACGFHEVSKSLLLCTIFTEQSKEWKSGIAMLLKLQFSFDVVLKYALMLCMDGQISPIFTSLV